MTPDDPRVRISDADREQTVQALERYVSEGYLTLDEFSDRSATAYRATTRGELASLTADLAPAPDRHHPAAPARRASDPRSWSPVVLAVVAVAGVVLLAAAAMAVMMLGMLGGMGGMP